MFWKKKQSKDELEKELKEKVKNDIAKEEEAKQKEYQRKVREAADLIAKKNVQFVLAISPDGEIMIHAYLPQLTSQNDAKNLGQILYSFMVVLAKGKLFKLFSDAVLKAGKDYHCEKTTKDAIDLAKLITKDLGVGPDCDEIVVHPTEAFSMREGQP